MMRLILVLALIFSVASPAAQAKDIRDKYQEVTLTNVLNFLITNKLIELKKTEDYIGYLKIAECALYNSVKDSQFKQQEIQEALKKKFDQPVRGDGILYFKIPTVLGLGNYNFDTQSIDILPANQMNKVNMLALIETDTPTCDGSSAKSTSLPVFYSLQLAMPISLYRIPLKKAIAESILPQLDRLQTGSKIPVLYGMLYVQIEPVPPRFETYFTATRGMLHGQLNMIEVFTDQERKTMLKRLNYEENY